MQISRCSISIVIRYQFSATGYCVVPVEMYAGNCFHAEGCRCVQAGGNVIVICCRFGRCSLYGDLYRCRSGACTTVPAGPYKIGVSTGIESRRRYKCNAVQQVIALVVIPAVNHSCYRTHYAKGSLGSFAYGGIVHLYFWLHHCALRIVEIYFRQCSNYAGFQFHLHAVKWFGRNKR